MVFGFLFFLRDMPRVTVMIYEFCMFITLVPIHLSKIAGIRALCISLSLIDFLTKFTKGFLFYTLLHFSKNSYIAAEGPFQFMNLKAMTA